VVSQDPEAPPESLDYVKLAAARLRAAGMQPFLAMALYAMSPVPDQERETFAVDERWRLYVHPGKLREWTVPQVAGVLLHEVGHLVRDHAGRAKAALVRTETAAVRWNVAADAEINDDLLDADIELPPGPVTPAALGLPPYKAAEFYYSRLAEADDLPVGAPNCGSGSHGLDEAGPDRGGTLPRGLSDVEALLLRRRVAEAITRIAAQQPGSIAGDWVRWAEALLRPQVDWRRLLSAALKSATAAVVGSVDYSYAKPARRRVPRVVLPALQRPVPRVAIIIDTSASVADEQLSTAWTEVHGCVRALGIRRDMLTVYAADTAVHRIVGVTARQADLTGGGGTDMAAAIEEVAARRPRPALLVVITDGMTGWPARPAQDLVVVLLKGSFTPPEPPSWARVIRVTDGT
jgi:predicted metal-dependent peptidase